MRAQTRHQLKQDKFSRVTIGAAEKTFEWSAEHKTRLIVMTVAVAVVAGVVLGGWYYLSQQDQKASVALSQAVRTLNTPIRPAGMPPQPDSPSFASAKERATQAHKEFAAIVQNYPHTRSSEFAHYFVGLTSADLGDNAAAERELKSVASSHNDDLAALANMALASVYRSTNRNKEAIDIYKKLIDKPTRTVGKTTAQMELAATYQSAQQPQEAKKIYEQIQKENATGEAGQLAAQKLQALK